LASRRGQKRADEGRGRSRPVLGVETRAWRSWHPLGIETRGKEGRGGAWHARGEGVLTEGAPPSRNSSEGGVGGGVSTKENPLCLVFRAREGWRGCVDREPLRLAIQAGEGLVVVCRQKKTLPSRVSSEGPGVGWRGCVDREPPRLAIRAREGWGGEGVLTENPSVSQFERGRGWWWRVDRRKSPSVSHFKQGRGGGCVDKRKNPSVSRFERGRGCVDGCAVVVVAACGRMVAW
jgi:hypothetical protein